MVTGKVKSGDVYKGMAQSVSIVILDYRLWKSDARYHHRFRLHDPDAGLSYPNSLEIHTLELPKRPADNDGSVLWCWLAFFSSKTREEFDSLAGKGSAMAEAVGRLIELSSDEKARMQADARDKWLWDQAARKRQHYAEGEAVGEARGMAQGLTKGMAQGVAQGLTKGMVQGKAEIVRRMLQAKMSLSEIAGLTGLPLAEIDRLSADEQT